MRREDPSKKPETLEADDIQTTHTTRRGALTTIAAASTALLTIGASPALAQRGRCTDADPYDRAGHGRHCAPPPPPPPSCSDSDPYDPAGRGRHCGTVVSCSDHDPYDPVGRGRHCAPTPPPPPPPRRCSDHDPYDPAGHGRHC